MVANEDLCAALIAVGAEPCALPDTSGEALERLTAMGLAEFVDGDWTVTTAGAKLLKLVREGDAVEFPSAISRPHFDVGSRVGR